MLTAFEDIPLWHERDISHSSVERIIIPDATTLLDYMLVKVTSVLSNLTVFEKRMLKNIELTNGVIFSQRVMTTLIDKCLFTREKAYDLVQPIAMEAWENNHSFKELLENNVEIMGNLTVADLNECFSLEFHLRNVEEIYNRVGIF